MDVQVGSTITNGSSCIRVEERVARDARWRCSGWRGISIPLEEFGGNPGMTEFVADYLLTGWYHVPFEWRAIPGGLEERYTWTPDWRRLQREVRKAHAVQPTVDGIRGHRIDTPADAALRDALGVGEPISRADAQALMAELGLDELDLVQRQDFKLDGDS
jgi:hypothetical protein